MVLVPALFLAMTLNEPLEAALPRLQDRVCVAPACQDVPSAGAVSVSVPPPPPPPLLTVTLLGGLALPEVS